MQVTVEKSKPTFQPIRIEIEIESEDELKDLCHLIRERTGMRVPMNASYSHQNRIREANRYGSMMERASAPIRNALKSLDRWIESE